MKKNRMMRLASILLVCVLLSTSVISGTFAKYVTTDAQQDTARVAKWGVVASISGDLFGATYTKAEDGNKITTYSENAGTVSSVKKTVDGETVADSFVVAPGTKNDQGLTISITGTPEVSTKVHFDAAEDAKNDAKDYANSDINLAPGTYGIMVKYEGVLTEDNVGTYWKPQGNGYVNPTSLADVVASEGVYELLGEIKVAYTEEGPCDKDGYYRPVKWTVKFDNGTTRSYTKIEEIKADLLEHFNDKEFAPNKSNALSVNMTWAWAYNTAWDDVSSDTKENTSDADLMDTILGNMIYAANEGDTKTVHVVVMSGAEWLDVEYKNENAATDSANQVCNVYIKGSQTKVACLTVAFNARITVEQVD